MKYEINYMIIWYYILVLILFVQKSASDAILVLW